MASPTSATSASGLDGNGQPQPPPQQPQPQQDLSSSTTNPSGAGSISSSTVSKEQLERLTNTMFQNISAYLRSELSATSEDYKLLEDMNKAAIGKYTDMGNLATGLLAFMQALQVKYNEFQPYIDRLDQVESGLTELEQTVAKLDEYTKKLESKFKVLQNA